MFLKACGAGAWFATFLGFIFVEKFHKLGVELGGKSEGAPGERPEGSKVYYSYVRDLDGNKICVFTNI